MLTLSTLIIITIVCTQGVKAVNNLFNDDFNLNFDNESCRSKTKWHLINYTNINLNNTYHNNQVISMNSSCASLFGKDLLPDSEAEVNTYLLIKYLDYGLKVTVFGELKIPIKNYEYSRTRDISEWDTIKILVNNTIFGYYDFNEGVQTIKIYKEKTGKELSRTTKKIQDIEKLSQDEEIDKSEYLLPYNFDKIYDILLSDEGSGDSSGDNEITPPGNITDDPDISPNSIWKPWNIILIAVGSFIIISVICISAYHIGKRRSQEENANIIDLEHSPDFRIPRVRSIYSSFSDRITENEY